MSAPFDLGQFMEDARKRIDTELDRVLPAAQEPPPLLHEAMRYAVFAGGKRLRPALAFAAARACSVPAERVLPVAAAVELVHAYSLVHDDLPAMDDDDERRGRPSVHVKFGEATAILAGDALLALAFEVLSVSGPAVGRLAEAAGSRFLVGGQSDDLGLRADACSREALLSIHGRKTGALFAFALGGAAELADAGADTAAALEAFGLAYGMVFQAADDLTDDDPDECSLLRVLSVEELRTHVRLQAESGRERLVPFGARADALDALVDHLAGQVL